MVRDKHRKQKQKQSEDMSFAVTGDKSTVSHGKEGDFMQKVDRCSQGMHQENRE